MTKFPEREFWRELAPRRIRVNSIHPDPLDNSFQRQVEDGLTEVVRRDGTVFFNEMTRLGRYGTAEEVARSVLYLATDQSSFTTGAILMIDGGMSA